MTDDIAALLNFEIKKELADRYFGFRKIIEEDKSELENDVRFLDLTMGQKIVTDLNRLYVMLDDEKLITEFLMITGLEESVYFDPYILTSANIRKRLFEGVKTKGLTAAGRFQYLFRHCYEQLVYDVDEYRAKYAELIDNQETIEEEITLFYKKNDISHIIGFFRSMDAVDFGSNMEGPLQSGYTESLEEKMRISPPLNVKDKIPQFPPLIPLPQIKKKLKKLAELAFLHHKRSFVLP